MRSKKSLKDFRVKVRFFFYKAKTDDLHGLATELSFTLLLTLFPLLVVIVSFFLLVQEPKAITNLSKLIGGTVMPEAVYHPIDKSIVKLVKHANKKAFLVSLILSFFTSFTIFTAVIKSMNRIYGLEKTYGFWKGQLLALRLYMVVVVYFFLVGNFTYGFITLEKWLAKTYKFLWIRQHYDWLVPMFLFLVLFLLSTLVYQYSSLSKRSFRETWRGAFALSLFWVGLSMGFTLFLKYQNLGVDYSVAYSVISKMVSLMLWTYLNSMLFLIGAQINFFRRLKLPPLISSF